MADNIGERPVSPLTLPSQQTLTIKQAFLEGSTAVLAQFSLPNLYEIRHSILNSELVPNDADPFHGGGRTYQRSDGDSFHTPSYIEMEALGDQQDSHTDMDDEMSESQPIEFLSKLMKGGINFPPQPRRWGGCLKFKVEKSFLSTLGIRYLLFINCTLACYAYN